MLSSDIDALIKGRREKQKRVHKEKAPNSSASWEHRKAETVQVSHPLWAYDNPSNIISRLQREIFSPQFYLKFEHAFKHSWSLSSSFHLCSTFKETSQLLCTHTHMMHKRTLNSSWHKSMLHVTPCSRWGYRNLGKGWMIGLTLFWSSYSWGYEIIPTWHFISFSSFSPWIEARTLIFWWLPCIRSIYAAHIRAQDVRPCVCVVHTYEL